ncbi:unnamed protein product [Closterium sp. Naga37s-1]|nr:unnamed protein product [Closterium sp. Naga37s-1]
MSSHRPHPSLHHQLSFTPATGERLKSVAPPIYSIVNLEGVAWQEKARWEEWHVERFTLFILLPPITRRRPPGRSGTWSASLSTSLKSPAQVPCPVLLLVALLVLVAHLLPPPSPHHLQVSFNPATGERLKSVAPPTYSIVNLEGVTWQEKARWEERHVERFTLDLTQISRPGPLPGAAAGGAGAGGGGGSGGGGGGAGNGNAAGVKEAGDYSAPAAFDALNQQLEEEGGGGGGAAAAVWGIIRR